MMGLVVDEVEQSANASACPEVPVISSKSWLSERSLRLLSIVANGVLEVHPSSRAGASLDKLVVGSHEELAGLDVSTASRSVVISFRSGDEAPPSGLSVIRDCAGHVVAGNLGVLVCGSRRHELFVGDQGKVLQREGEVLADSVVKLIEKVAIIAELEERATWIRAAFRPFLDLRFAELLGARLVEAASDSAHRIWEWDGGRLVSGGAPPFGNSGDTMIVAERLSDVARCMSVAHEDTRGVAAMDVLNAAWEREARPPEEAPECWNEVARRDTRAVSTLSEGCGASGHWGIAPGRPSVELILSVEHDGAVIRRGHLFEGGGILFDYADTGLFLRKRLSERCVLYYEQMGVRRDYRERGDAESRRVAFAKAGIELGPVREAFERDWGGVHLGDLRMGIHAGLIRGGRRRVVAPDGVEVIHAADLEGDPAFYLDHDGRVYVDSLLTNLIPVADSWTVLLEGLEAAGQWSRWPVRHNRLEVDALVGSAVAEALGVPVFAPGTDSFARIWLDAEVEVFERKFGMWTGGNATMVVTRNRDDLVKAMLVAYKEAPAARVEVSPLDDLARCQASEPVLRWTRRWVAAEIQVHRWKGRYLVGEVPI